MNSGRTPVSADQPTLPPHVDPIPASGAGHPGRISGVAGPWAALQRCATGDPDPCLALHVPASIVVALPCCYWAGTLGWPDVEGPKAACVASGMQGFAPPSSIKSSLRE